MAKSRALAYAKRAPST